MPIFPLRSAPTLCFGISGPEIGKKCPEGTYSHDTALSLHELSDIMPSKLHMTVPREFRRNSKIPEILVLHRAHLDPSEVQEMHGIRVTRALRTIVDLLRSGHVDRSQLKLAVDEAIRRGLIAREKSIACPTINCNVRFGSWPSSPRDGRGEILTRQPAPFVPRSKPGCRLARASKALTCSAYAGKWRSTASWHECFRRDRRRRIRGC